MIEVQVSLFCGIAVCTNNFRSVLYDYLKCYDHNILYVLGNQYTDFPLCISCIMYHRQQNKWYTQRCQTVTITAV